MSRIKSLYVLSAGRSGSTFLAHFLSSLSDSSQNLDQNKHSRYLNILSNLALINNHFKKYLIRYIESANENNNPEATCDALKSIALTIYLSEKKCLNTKIIHVVRDPRNFVTSFMKWKNRKISSLLLNHYVPFWQPNPYLLGRNNLVRHLSMDKFTHFCWIWRLKNELIMNLSEHYSDYLLVRLEDLVASNKVMESLLHFANINKSFDRALIQQKINKSPKDGFVDWISWKAKHALILNNICGSLMNEFGYGLEEEWLNKIT